MMSLITALQRGPPPDTCWLKNSVTAQWDYCQHFSIPKRNASTVQTRIFFFWRKKKKLGIPGMSQSLQKRWSSYSTIEQVMLHLESVCGSDRGACWGTTVGRRELPVSTRQFQIKYDDQPPSNAHSSHGVWWLLGLSKWCLPIGRDRKADKKASVVH